MGVCTPRKLSADLLHADSLRTMSETPIFSRLRKREAKAMRKQEESPTSANKVPQVPFSPFRKGSGYFQAEPDFSKSLSLPIKI